MNTVDSLNKLGKALCGDAYVYVPGLTDAEAISKVADSIAESGGISGNAARHIAVTVTTLLFPFFVREYSGKTSPNLTARDLANAWFDLNYGPTGAGYDQIVCVPILLVVSYQDDKSFDLYSPLTTSEILDLRYNSITGEIFSGRAE